MDKFDSSGIGTNLDPSFFLPPNVIDMRYLDVEEEVDDDVDAGAGQDDGQDVIDTGLDDYTPLSDSLLPIPDTFSIVSQTVRASAGGGYVVDVVVNIGDISGIENFDLAVTKS